MARNNRLFSLIATLRGGGLHRAEDLARKFGVSVRTIYRDLDRLAEAGVPVSGTRGSGYRAQADVTLPPMDLSLSELEALHLALAVVSEAGDDELRRAAEGLWARIDAALPEDGADPATIWGHALGRPGGGRRALRHLSAIRAAVRARQKLALSLDDGARLVIRPLELSYWGRVWALTAWSEDDNDFRIFDPTAISEVQVLPQLFVDEPGRRLVDFRARSGNDQ